MPYILLIYCLHTSPTNSRHCNLPHFVTCKAQKPTNHVEPDMKEENRKEKTIHHQENENIELQGGHVPFDPTGIKHIQKTPFSFKKNICKPYVSLIYSRILPYMCEDLFLVYLLFSLVQPQKFIATWTKTILARISTSSLLKHWRKFRRCQLVN